MLNLASNSDVCLLCFAYADRVLYKKCQICFEDMLPSVKCIPLNIGLRAGEAEQLK